jgi:hypothetical protein
MAVVNLRGRWLRPDMLPNVCMVCGRPAKATLRKRFTWHPPWVIVTVLLGLLPYVVLALALTKRIAVDVPLCRRHRSYWGQRFLLFFGSFILMIVLAVATAVVLAEVLGDGRNGGGGFACAGIICCILVWFAAVFGLQHMSLRPSEITDRSIELTNVSEEFVLAYEDLRDDRENVPNDADDSDRSRPQRPRDKDRSPDPSRDAFRPKRGGDHRSS